MNSTSERERQRLARAILAADPPSAEPLLRRAGFEDPARANHALDRLAGPPGDLTPVPVPVLASVIGCGWPDRGLQHLERFVTATGGRATLFGRLAGSPPLRHRLVKVLAHSRFLTDVLVRNPEFLYWLFESAPHLGTPIEGRRLRSLLTEELAPVPISQRSDALRRLQRRELLRIGAAEILDLKNVAVSGGELADLADVVIEVALDLNRRDLTQRYGRPLNARGRPALFVVVGLGKYGGRELNFSSDVDLLFVYDDDGRTHGIRGRSGIDNHLFFQRLGEGLIQTLTESTHEGFLYRVDMRLRPESEAGPLTRSLRSHWIYYETRGQLWERQMLIKARRAAGSGRLWSRLREMLVPFVYPAHFDVSPREEIRRIKERIELDIRRRRGGDNHIKLQAGGIRDIEFIVQCLQLLRGRQCPRVRQINTLQAIERLRSSGVLAAAEARALEEAYRFLRRLENLLQIESDRATYAIPDDAARQRSLAWLLHLPPGERIEAATEAHMQGVRSIYDSLFYGDAPRTRDQSMSLSTGLDPAADAGEEGHLKGFGFRDPRTAGRILRGLAGAPMLMPSGRRRLEALLPALLSLLAASPDPDGGLVRFAGIVGAYGAPGAFFAMAAGHPRFLSMLVTICGSSALLADLLMHDPGLLDGLVGIDLDDAPPAPGSRAGIDALRRWRDAQLLRIGADDLLGLASSEETFHRLSEVADTVVGAVLRHVRADLGRRLGRPRRRGGGEAHFVCLAGGKAGGRELDFASDLDLFFIYDGDGASGRGVDNREFFSELARRIIAGLGPLFPVDARLRPEGRGAPVVTDLRGYRRYLRSRASSWERLALSRVRCLAGDPDLAARAVASIERFVYGEPLRRSVLEEIAGVRGRMEPGRKRGGVRRIDIKRGPGGIVDVEFIAQILLLRYAHRRKRLRHTSTRVVLERMVDAGFLPPATGRRLLRDYERLRQLQKAMRLAGERSGHALPTGTALGCLARAVGLDTPEELTSEAQILTARVRDHYERILDDLRRDLS